MKNEMIAYESPLVEIVEMEVEKGFAGSEPVEVSPLPDWLPGEDL